MTGIAAHDTSRTGDRAGTPVVMRADRPYFVGRFPATPKVSDYAYYDHLKDEWVDRRNVLVEHVASARTLDEAIAAIFTTMTADAGHDITSDVDRFARGRRIRCGDAIIFESEIDQTGFVPVRVADENFAIGLPDFKSLAGSDCVGVWHLDGSARIHLGDRRHSDIGDLIGNLVNKELAWKANEYAAQGLAETESRERAAADMSPEGATPYSYADMVATAADVTRNWEDFVDRDSEDARPCAWRFADSAWLYQISANVIEHSRAVQTLLGDAETYTRLRSDGTITRTVIETRTSPNPDSVTLAGTPAQYKDLHAAISERTNAQHPRSPRRQRPR